MLGHACAEPGERPMPGQKLGGAPKDRLHKSTVCSLQSAEPITRSISGCGECNIADRYCPQRPGRGTNEIKDSWSIWCHLDPGVETGHRARELEAMASRVQHPGFVRSIYCTVQEPLLILQVMLLNRCLFSPWGDFAIATRACQGLQAW